MAQADRTAQAEATKGEQDSANVAELHRRFPALDGVRPDDFAAASRAYRDVLDGLKKELDSIDTQRA